MHLCRAFFKNGCKKGWQTATTKKSKHLFISLCLASSLVVAVWNCIWYNTGQFQHNLGPQTDLILRNFVSPVTPVCSAVSLAPLVYLIFLTQLLFSPSSTCRKLMFGSQISDMAGGCDILLCGTLLIVPSWQSR